MQEIFVPPTAFAGVGLFVCLSVFCTISQKSMQLGLPDLTQKCSTMIPDNLFILGSKVKCQDHE